MDNNLLIKEVEFNENNILAIKDLRTNKVYAGVKWICEGLGLDARRQKEKIQEHEVFSKGVSTLPLPSSGGNQETLVIELDFLPLWLANINPKLVNSNAKDKLIEYQLKAKDVLAKAFLPQYGALDLANTYMDMCEEDKAILYFTTAKENRLQKEQLLIQQPKIEGYDRFLESESTHTFKDAAKIISTRCKDDMVNVEISAKKLTSFLRDAGILSKEKSHGQYMNYPNQDYEHYFNTTSVTIKEGEEKEFKRTSTKVKPNGLEFIYNLVKKNIKEKDLLEQVN